MGDCTYTPTPNLTTTINEVTGKFASLKNIQSEALSGVDTSVSSVTTLVSSLTAAFTQIQQSLMGLDQLLTASNASPGSFPSNASSPSLTKAEKGDFEYESPTAPKSYAGPKSIKRASKIKVTAKAI